MSARKGDLVHVSTLLRVSDLPVELARIVARSAFERVALRGSLFLVLNRGGCMLVYTLLDRKLKEFGALVLGRNDEGVRRSVVDGVVGSKSVIELHPGDFDVFCVGEFDQESGMLTTGRPRLVSNVGELMEAVNGAR